MKTEILAAHAALGVLLEALPNDPAPPPATPTNFRATGTFGTDPIDVVMEWDPLEPSCDTVLEYKADEGNALGPQSWEPVNPPSQPIMGQTGTLTIHNPTGKSFVIRLRARRNADNQFSEAVFLSFPVL